VDETFDVIVGRLAAASPEELTRFLDRTLEVVRVDEADWSCCFHQHIAGGIELPERFAVGDVIRGLAPDREGAILWFGARAGDRGRVFPIQVAELADQAALAGLDVQVALLDRLILDRETSVFLRSARGQLDHLDLSTDAMIASMRAFQSAGARAALAAASVRARADGADDDDDDDDDDIVRGDA
jgi:hypothetical protein